MLVGVARGVGGSSEKSYGIIFSQRLLMVGCLALVLVV